MQQDARALDCTLLPGIYDRLAAQVLWPHEGAPGRFSL
jgi:hypothetical protein